MQYFGCAPVSEEHTASIIMDDGGTQPTYYMVKYSRRSSIEMYVVCTSGFEDFKSMLWMTNLYTTLLYNI
jgi:hypothetical protein